MVVEVRRQVVAGERVEQRRQALRDVVVAEEAAHDRGVLALGERVVTGHEMQTRGNCRDSHPPSSR